MKQHVVFLVELLAGRKAVDQLWYYWYLWRCFKAEGCIYFKANEHASKERQ